MTKTILTIIFLLSTALPLQADETQKQCIAITSTDLYRKGAPRFEQFPAETKRIKKPKINLKSHPDASTYRTVLREGVANGPNFAGHYAIVEWGCGTSCIQWAIVDITSGEVFSPNSFQE